MNVQKRDKFELESYCSCTFLHFYIIHAIQMFQNKRNLYCNNYNRLSEDIKGIEKIRRFKYVEKNNNQAGT